MIYLVPTCVSVLIVIYLATCLLFSCCVFTFICLCVNVSLLMFLVCACTIAHSVCVCVCVCVRVCMVCACAQYLIVELHWVFSLY